MSATVTDADRIAAAKIWLISAPRNSQPDSPRGLPYLAHALYALTTVACTDIPTMTCDEHWRIYVNPNWLTSADLREVGSELAHLSWHLLHDHAGRARSMRVDADTAPHWKRASDCALEPTLAANQLTPAPFPDARTLAMQPGRSAEEYYAALSRLPAIVASGPASGATADLEPGCGSGCDGLSRPHEMPPGLDLGEVGQEDARQLRRLVAIAYREHVTSRGDTPGDAWRWTQEILEPTVRWEPLLAGAVRRAIAWTNGHTDYTYRRRSRRQSALPEIVLPGTRRPVPTVAVVIDTSSSVDDTLIARALGEVDGALRGLGVSDGSVTVVSCDAAVHTVDRVRHARDVRLGGGGGTDLRPGLRAASELRPRPDVIIVITDGYTPWPATPPPATLVITALLARTGQTTPPTPSWTTRIDCRI